MKNEDSALWDAAVVFLTALLFFGLAIGVIAFQGWILMLSLTLFGLKAPYLACCGLVMILGGGSYDRIKDKVK